MYICKIYMHNICRIYKRYVIHKIYIRWDKLQNPTLQTKPPSGGDQGAGSALQQRSSENPIKINPSEKTPWKCTWKTMKMVFLWKPHENILERQYRWQCWSVTDIFVQELQDCIDEPYSNFLYRRTVQIFMPKVISKVADIMAWPFLLLTYSLLWRVYCLHLYNSCIYWLFAHNNWWHMLIDCAYWTPTNIYRLQIFMRFSSVCNCAYCNIEGCPDFPPYALSLFLRMAYCIVLRNLMYCTALYFLSNLMYYTALYFLSNLMYCTAL